MIRTSQSKFLDTTKALREYLKEIYEVLLAHFSIDTDKIA